MRISDWSSDVCSSDLVTAKPARKIMVARIDAPAGKDDRAGGERHRVGAFDKQQIGRGGAGLAKQHQRGGGDRIGQLIGHVDDVRPGTGECYPAMSILTDSSVNIDIACEKSEEHTSE